MSANDKARATYGDGERAYPNFDDERQVAAFSQRFLEAARYEQTEWLPRERFGSNARLSPEVQVHALRDTVNRMVLRMQSKIYREVVLTDQHAYPVEIDVPWEATAIVTLSRTWWQRLLRRPSRSVHMPMSGIVRGRTTIHVQARHFAAYPEFRPVPADFGTPIAYSEFTPLYDAAWAQHTETRPQTGAAAADDHLED